MDYYANIKTQFGNVKTARAQDNNLNTVYEVVYLEVIDQNTNSSGQGPADSIDLHTKIDVPYYYTLKA